MNKKGFTLVELLAAIVILGLVLTIVGTKGFGAFDNTKKAITKENINAIKEAANVLAVQIDNCDDELDSELWNSTSDLTSSNNITDKNCSGLKTKMSSDDCINVTVGYLIENNYLSENKDFESLKNSDVNICKKNKKITIDMDNIKVDETKPDDESSDESNDKPTESNNKTLSNVIKKSAETAKNDNDTTRTKMGSEVTEFTNISGTNEKVLNMAPDDYGTSYYFRGNVIDNYVNFANKLWRIVRINGDNTIRIILDDVAKNTSDVIRVRYNYPQYNDNAYVGYMYGTKNASSYSETHLNTNSSTIKTQVDAWYKTNIVDTNNAAYVADTLFCADKSTATKTSINLGYGQQPTDYAITDRISKTKNGSEFPTLKCSYGSDYNYSRYTVEKYDLANGTKTNGNLTYPIGLLSYDEVMYAGEYGFETNKHYYLYNSSIKNYWYTMTPYNYAYSSYARVIIVNSTEGSGEVYDVTHNESFRPVLNLKQSIIVEFGNGTKNNPYILDIN